MNDTPEHVNDDAQSADQKWADKKRKQKAARDRMVQNPHLTPMLVVYAHTL